MSAYNRLTVKLSRSFLGRPAQYVAELAPSADGMLYCTGAGATADGALRELAWRVAEHVAAGYTGPHGPAVQRLNRVNGERCAT